MNGRKSIQYGGQFRIATVPDRGNADRSLGAGYRGVLAGPCTPTWALAVLILIPLTSSGCLTSALWDSADPDQRVWVPAAKTTEEKLKEEGLRYQKCRFTREQLREKGMVCDGEVVEGFLVEKSDLERFGDLTWRIVATPVTLTLDVCCGIVVLADCDCIWLAALLHCACH